MSDESYESDEDVVSADTQQLLIELNNNNISAIQLLLDAARYSPPNIIMYLCMCICDDISRPDCDHKWILQRVLAHPDANPAKNNCECLFQAVINRITPSVEVLMQDPRVDPSVCNHYIPYAANVRGHIKIETYLLSDPRVFWTWDMAKPRRRTWYVERAREWDSLRNELILATLA